MKNCKKCIYGSGNCCFNCGSKDEWVVNFTKGINKETGKECEIFFIRNGYKEFMIIDPQFELLTNPSGNAE